MICKVLLASAMLTAVTACSTAVPRTDAEKQKVAGEIATLMTDPKMVDGIIDSMSGIVMPTMRNMCETVPESQHDACLERVEKARPAVDESMKEAMDQVKAVMPELMQEMGAIMARLYTGEELAKMKDYYSSSEGKSIMHKQPQVMAEYMPLVTKRMQSMQIEMMRKVQKRVAEALSEGGIIVAEPPI
jgi:hypothetical protein